MHKGTAGRGGGPGSGAGEDVKQEAQSGTCLCSEVCSVKVPSGGTCKAQQNQLPPIGSKPGAGSAPGGSELSGAENGAGVGGGGSRAAHPTPRWRTDSPCDVGSCEDPESVPQDHSPRAGAHEATLRAPSGDLCARQRFRSTVRGSLGLLHSFPHLLTLATASLGIFA